jgi:predicted CoA-binding protein
MEQDTIRKQLAAARTIAVVGLSSTSTRPSYSIARYLQRQGYRIIPVNPTLAGSVLGEMPVASLRDIGEHVDIVNIFRRPEYVPAVVEDALAIGAGMVWMQPGAESAEALRRAEAAGLPAVAGECIMVQHRMLL